MKRNKLIIVRKRAKMRIILLQPEVLIPSYSSLAKGWLRVPLTMHHLDMHEEDTSLMNLQFISEYGSCILDF